MNPEAIQARVWEHLSTIDRAQDECPICGGLGVLTLNLPLDHELFGQAFHCICQRSEILHKRLRAALGDSADAIPRAAYQFDIDDFARVPSARKAYPLARQLAEDGRSTLENKDKPGLLLWGGTGTGKTTLAVSILRWRAVLGDSVAFTDYTDLIKRIQRTYAKNYDGDLTEDEIIKSVSKAGFLVLDDLGSVASDRATDNRIEIVFRVINGRYAANLPTVITTNLTPDKLYSQFGDRVSSRIVGLCHIVEMQGTDLRTK